MLSIKASIKRTSRIQHFKRERVRIKILLNCTEISCVLNISIDAPSKQKLKDKQKIQEAITKSVNRKNEDEMRSRAVSHQQNLSSAQKAVAKHHDKAKKPVNETMEAE